MTDLRTAAQQALEALESCQDGDYTTGDVRQSFDEQAVNAAIVALWAALAEPVQEPVAWMCPDDPERETAFAWKPGHCVDCGKQRIALYATPPQRKPLTVTKMPPRKLPEDNDE